MNPQEQRTHKTTTDKLGERLDDVERILVELDARATQIGEATIASVQAERAHRLKLADECRNSDQEIVRALAALRDRPLLGRLRWVVLGR